MENRLASKTVELEAMIALKKQLTNRPVEMRASRERWVRLIYSRVLSTASGAKLLKEAAVDCMRLALSTFIGHAATGAGSYTLLSLPSSSSSFSSSSSLFALS